MVQVNKNKITLLLQNLRVGLHVQGNILKFYFATNWPPSTTDHEISVFPIKLILLNNINSFML